MSDLGVALLGNEQDVINICLYLSISKNKSGATRVTVLGDEEGKKMYDDPEQKGKVQVLNTRWRQSRWKEENDLINRIQEPNPITQQMEPNWSKYRDLRIKLFLVEWDLTANGKQIPVSPEAIDRLPPSIPLELYDRYLKSLQATDAEDEKK